MNDEITDSPQLFHHSLSVEKLQRLTVRGVDMTFVSMTLEGLDKRAVFKYEFCFVVDFLFLHRSSVVTSHPTKCRGMPLTPVHNQSHSFAVYLSLI